MIATKPYVGTCPLCKVALDALRVRAQASTAALKRLGVGADCLATLLKEKAIESFTESNANVVGGQTQWWRMARSR